MINEKQNCGTCFYWRYKKDSAGLCTRMVEFTDLEVVENFYPFWLAGLEFFTNERDGKYCPAYRRMGGIYPSRLQVIREAKQFLLKSYGEGKTPIIENDRDEMPDKATLICGVTIRFKVLEGTKAIYFKIISDENQEG